MRHSHQSTQMRFDWDSPEPIPEEDSSVSTSDCSMGSRVFSGDSATDSEASAFGEAERLPLDFPCGVTPAPNGNISYVEGGTCEPKKLISGVYDLRDNGYSSVLEFFGFSSWEEVVEYSKFEYGQEPATFVQLVQSFGLGRLWHVLKNVADDPEQASVTISTTHKAKGREWGRVRMEDDFVLSQEDEDGNQ